MQTAALFDIREQDEIRDQTVEGEVSNIIYQDASTGFRVFNLRQEGGHLVKCAGNLPPVRSGLTVRCRGEWEHTKYGKQFSTEQLTYRDTKTQDLDAYEAFLASGIVEGIGFMRAAKIVAHFDSVDAIKNAMWNPDALQEVDGIGPLLAQTIAAAYQEIDYLADYLTACAELDIDSKTAMKIFEALGANSLDVITTTPYELMAIPGIGWQAADEIALQTGVELTSPLRINAGIGHATHRESWQAGDCYLHPNEVKEAASRLLRMRIKPQHVKEAEEAGAIIIEETQDHTYRFYPRTLYDAETKLAKRLKTMLQEPHPLPRPETLTSSVRGILDPRQKEAVKLALKHRVAFITGGPGTGKSFILKVILEEFYARDHRNILFVAPTGKAAKRIQGATGQKAQTIHRALGFNGEGFAYDADHPIPYQTVVVDETSMADVSLAHRLVSALPRGARILLVGDVDQLPSVGPGMVLGDIIQSGVIPGVRLEKIYRQRGDGMQIAAFAQAVNAWQHGDELLIPPDYETGAALSFVKADRGNIEAVICDLVAQDLPKAGFPPEDVQVITPRRNGPGSVQTLNQELRYRLNPSQRVVGRFGIGDRVMQTRNVYDLGPEGIMNGDQGRITDVKSVADSTGGRRKVVTVDIDDVGKVPYSIANLRHLTHAYAITIHKAQGAQYPCVVIALLPEHGRLLSKRLLYTAITRAASRCVLVGSPEALQTAIRTDEVIRRKTALGERLGQYP
jgi:exodeoxyribonuclease V alpha subunit